MPENSGEKTLDATPHRREQAREKGQVAFSQDLGSATLLIIGVLLLLGMGSRLVDFSASLMQRNLGDLQTLVADRSMLLVQWRFVLSGLSQVLLPILGLVFLSAVLTNLFQIGFLWVPDRLAPDISRLNPISGLQRIFSLRGTMRIGFGLFKVLIIGVVMGCVAWVRWDDLLRSTSYSIPQLSRFLAGFSLDSVLWIGAALLVLAIVDYAFQRWKHEQDLKMTHQEVREEMKNLQGDPQVIARRRAIQRQMVLNRIGSAVPQADVVVTNPTELAVAIQYDPSEMAAPIVVAKGAGVIAQRIRRLALENDIPIVERKPLARLLYKEVDVNGPVPDSSYAAVAEILAYVYQLKGKKLPTAS